MGWDNFANDGNDLQDNRSIIDTLNKHDAGKKVYEVEEEVTFIVKYKVVAKDKSELITNKPGISFSNLDIPEYMRKNNDDKRDLTFDYRVRCCESKSIKEDETLEEVVLKYEKDLDGKDDLKNSYIDIERNFSNDSEF
jgi:hypothetical protein